MPDACVADCSHQGDCDEDVESWVPKLRLNIDPDILRGELAEYGAWDDEELSNHEMNIRHIIWIAACNIREEEYEARKN